MKTHPWGAAALAALLLAAASGVSAETVRVQVKGSAFVSAHVSAHIGDTVEWTNDDYVVHTAMARNGAWDVPSWQWAHELQVPSEVEYYCRFHPNMKGTIRTAP